MTLNSYVFQGTALINVDLGKLRSVGEGCFSCCSSLSKVSCGDSLTRISDFVFHKCSELRVVENLHRGVAVGGASPFADCPLLLRDVGEGGVDAIRFLNKRAEFWSRKRWIILAFLRFEDCVDKGSGSEQDKVNRALAKVYEYEGKQNISIRPFLRCCLLGGGTQGVLGATVRRLVEDAAAAVAGGVSEQLT